MIEPADELKHLEPIRTLLALKVRGTDQSGNLTYVPAHVNFDGRVKEMMELRREDESKKTWFVVIEDDTTMSQLMNGPLEPDPEYTLTTSELLRGRIGTISGMEIKEVPPPTEIPSHSFYKLPPDGPSPNQPWYQRFNKRGRR